MNVLLATLSLVSTPSALPTPEFTQTGVLSSVEISQKCKALFTNDSDMAAPATGTITLQKVVYPSKDSRGRPVMLSGLLAIPVDGAPRGIVVYYHGTTSENENVPSRYTGKSGFKEAELATLAFAAGGYAVVAPDYIGLGDSPGRHPYPLASVNALSGTDMVAAARTFGAGRGIVVGNDLFLTGYSEGGAVAMWAAKKLCEDGTLPVTGAVPMAGPYDMTGAETKSILSHQSNSVWLGARMYLLAYLGYSAESYIPGIDLSSMFAPSFASYIPHVFGKGNSDETVVKKIVQKGLQLGSLQSVRKLLTASFQKQLEAVDVSNPLIRRLKQENVYDWAPRCPLYMVCLKSDFVVDPENTMNAVRAMRARGLTNNLVGYTIIENNKLTHMTGIVSSTVLARRFMDAGFGAVPLDADPPPVGLGRS